MRGNETECSRPKQRSVIIYLVAEKCRKCEIYRRICVVNEEAYISPKNGHKWANDSFFKLESKR